MNVITSEGELQRITVVTDNEFEKLLYRKARQLGVHMYLCMFCSGKQMGEPNEAVGMPMVRVELLAKSDTGEQLIHYLRGQRNNPWKLTITVDLVKIP